ncbi:MAG: transporter substrate-binding domain-containing protein [Burkholderiales bacterium]
MARRPHGAARLAAMLLGLLAWTPLPVAHAADVAAAPLRVVTAGAAPFVLPQLAGPAGSPAGFSIDLWTELARRMNTGYTWIVVPSQAELLPAVADGRADVAIAAIGMTSGRERMVDFSHPYFDSGLRIMVRAQQENSFLATLQSIPWLAITQLFAVAAAIVFALANVLWLVERRQGRGTGPYLRAIGESLWGTMLVIATGEHGDRDAPDVVKRVAVVVMWLIGVVLVAQLTATVTSSQTVQRLQSGINGPEDLPGKSIGSVPGSVAGEWLTQHGYTFATVKNGPEGLRMLADGDVQAIVFDTATLEYWAARDGKGAVQVVGPLFRPEKFAIAVPNGSPLRKRINEALLAVYDDGAYEQLRAKWFAPVR